MLLYRNNLNSHINTKTYYFNNKKFNNIKGFTNFLILFGNDDYLKENNLKNLLKNYLIKPFIIYFGINDLNVGK